MRYFPSNFGHLITKVCICNSKENLVVTKG